MPYVYTILGFAALIVLHEAGHFAAAKAVGMRVEKFSLFFGRMFVSFRRGETVYGIGWLPLGGYVKITGMNPEEEMPPEVRPRAYYNQPPWKRIVVILAGPAVNLVIAFVVLFGVYSTTEAVSYRDGQPIGIVADQALSQPAASVLRPGDQIVAVDGRRGLSFDQIEAAIRSHRCAGAQRNGCQSATPVTLTVRRAGTQRTVSAYPRYSAQHGRMLLGFEFGVLTHNVGVGVLTAAHDSVDEMWTVTRETVSRIARIFESKDRRQIHGIVGSVTIVQQSFAYSAREALGILGLISLSLAVVNLFPFLPLDGGHVFWAVAEKVRRRRISFATMEKAGFVGFALIIALFLVGLTNDISTLSGSGFHVPH